MYNSDYGGVGILRSETSHDPTHRTVQSAEARSAEARVARVVPARVVAAQSREPQSQEPQSQELRALIVCLSSGGHRRRFRARGGSHVGRSNRLLRHDSTAPGHASGGFFHAFSPGLLGKSVSPPGRNPGADGTAGSSPADPTTVTRGRDDATPYQTRSCPLALARDRSSTGRAAGFYPDG